MSTRKESANRIMVGEGVKLLHIIQNRYDRVAVLAKKDEEGLDLRFELQELEGETWKPRLRLSYGEMDDILALFRTAKEIMRSFTSSDE